jgi:8-oxo-dGTP diphosphatase
MAIRVGARAAIIRDGAILLIEYDDETGLHYNLPGGGVEDGESIHDALRRELREEACVELATIGDLILTWEYVPAKYDYEYGTQQKLGLLFHCTIAPDAEPKLPQQPDPHQTGVKWIPLSKLSDIWLLPNIAHLLVPLLQNQISGISLLRDI